MNTIRIIIADDQQLFIEGIKKILESTDEFEVIGTANDGAALLEIASLLKPDIVLMDINMPGMDGLESCTLLKKKHKDIQVLILSSYSNIEFVANAMHAGADGYILKNSSIHTLTDAIIQIADGGRYISPELRGQNTMETFDLSKRQIEILRLVAVGLSAREIAEKLYLSVFTVETHRKNIQAKLGLKNQSMLVKYAVERGLIKEVKGS